jgi:hypothetical protein
VAGRESLSQERRGHQGRRLGLQPELRALPRAGGDFRRHAARKNACIKEIDGYFLTTVRAGRTRNGAVYMPPFEGTFSQEAMWAIKAYLETRREKPL